MLKICEDTGGNAVPQELVHWVVVVDVVGCGLGGGVASRASTVSLAGQFAAMMESCAVGWNHVQSNGIMCSRMDSLLGCCMGLDIVIDKSSTPSGTLVRAVRQANPREGPL